MKDINRKYRVVFSDPSGRVVLLDMLTELGFFDEIVPNTDGLILQNYARKLLKHCGIFKEVNKKLFVEELFNKSVPD